MSNQAAPEANAIIGHNSAKILTAEEIVAFLTEQYAPTDTAISALLADANMHVPKHIETKEENGIVGKFVTDIGDEIDALEAKRVAEKAPYLTAGRAIDAWFKERSDRLERARAVIKMRGHSYNLRVLEAQRAERERIAAEERAAAQKAAAEARATQQAAEEAAAAAARARKPERIEVLKELANEAAATADAARVEAFATSDAAQTSHNAASAKPAEMTRERHATGITSTMREVGFVELVDRTKIDFAVLAPFFKTKAIEDALALWAKQNEYKATMPGANVGKRAESVYL